MAAKPVTITIGAALANSVGSTVRGAQSHLQQLGSAMSRLNGQSAGITQMQKLRENAQQMGRAFASAQRHTEGLRASLTAAGPPTATQTREMHKAEAAADKARHALTQQREALRTMKGELQAAGVNTRSLADESVRLGAQMEKLQKRTTSLARAQNAQQANRDKRGQMVGDIFGMMAVGATLVMPVKMSMDFESSMADAAKTIDGMRDNAGNLTPEYYKMEKAVKQLGRTLPLTHEEIAKLFAAGGQQGLTVAEDLEEFATMSAHMSVAFGMGTDEAADAIGGYRTALKMSMPEVRSMLDLMNQYANTGSASEKGIADIVRRVGSLGNVGGVAAKPMTALAATLDSMKVSPEMAATGIKNLILAMTAGEAATKSQKKAYAELGIDTAELAKRMQKDGPGAITSVLEAIQKLPKHKQLSIMQEIFGKESLGSIAPLLDNLELVKQNLRIAADETAYVGAMQKEFANRSKTTANALVLLKNKTSELGITLGSTLLPSVVDGADALGSVMGRLVALSEKFPALSRVVVGGTMAALGLGIAWKAVGFAWSITKAPWLAAVTQVEKLRARMALASLEAGGTVPKFGKVGGALRALLPSLFSVNAALWANPIVLIGGAMALAGLAIYKYWEPLSEFFGGMWDGIGKAFAEADSSIAPLKENLGAVWDWLCKLFEPVRTTVDEMNSLTSAGESVGYVIGSVLKGAFDAVTAPIRFVLWGLDKIGEYTGGNSSPTSFESGMGSGVEMGDYAPVRRGPRAMEISRQRFEDYNVGMALQKKPGDSLFDSGMKAQPVAARTITNNNQPQISVSVTVPPGPDVQGALEAGRREAERLALYERGREAAGMYD